MKKTLLLVLLTAGLLSCSDDDSQKDLAYDYWALRSLNTETGYIDINIGEYIWDLDKAEGTLTVLENFNDEAHAEGLLPDGVYEVEVHGETIEVKTAGFEDNYTYSIRNGKLYIYLPGPKTTPVPADLQFESLEPIGPM